MAVSFQKPKILSAEDMFCFWAMNLKKERPYLILKNMNGVRKSFAQVWYEVKKEMEYLQERNAILQEKIHELEIQDRNIDKFRLTPLTKEIFLMKQEVMENQNKINSLRKKDPDTKELLAEYKVFKQVITLFNKKAAEEVIKGGILSFGHKLGFSQIRKIQPEVRGQIIDWGESKKYKKELEEKGIQPKDADHPDGKNWLVYHNQTFYLRWSWIKRYNRACVVKNNTVYAFYPTNSSSQNGIKGKVLGNKGKLSKALKEDSLLHLRYPLVVIGSRRYKKRRAQMNISYNTKLAA